MWLVLCLCVAAAGQPFSGVVLVERVTNAACGNLTLFTVTLVKDDLRDVRAVDVADASGPFVHTAAVFIAPRTYRTLNAHGTTLCESFVTFSALRFDVWSTDTDCTSIAPGFALGPTGFRGSWYCASGPGNVQVNGSSVALMQLVLPPGATASVTFDAYTRGAMSCRATVHLRPDRDDSFPCGALPELSIVSPTLPPEESNAWIAGLVIGMLMLVAALVIFVIACRRRRAGAAGRIYLTEGLNPDEQNSRDGSSIVAVQESERERRLQQTRSADDEELPVAHGVWRAQSAPPPAYSASANVRPGSAPATYSAAPTAHGGDDEFKYEDFL
jgi:hypothetical protein